MLAFSNDYYGMIFRATQSVELFCAYNDVVEFCKNKILDKNCNIYKQGKNWYCEIDNIKITINSYSYTIITAHLIK